uniref:non-specific serine/threonine protein kinase n=1 Tax=Manihot esculenta TaxID=3983 RepID=A0A2C9W3E9_MANES
MRDRLRKIRDKIKDGKSKLSSAWEKLFTTHYGLRQFTYKKLADATQNFSNNRLLGEGGFGQVYKGKIHGNTYAIKKLKRLPKKMEAEIKILSTVSHQNLVKLIGCCIEGADTLLVLEFAPNNSLKYHLHGNQGNEILEWSNRMKIAIGSANGLKYLHEGYPYKIIHRDIKTDNIVLDYDFEPKVTDFGLALFFPNDDTDVYSFGVVLLELITGKKTIINGTTIVNWARDPIRQALAGNHTALVDLKLTEYNREEMNRMIGCAAACLYKPFNSRPSMNQIIQTLEGIIPVINIWNENDSNNIPRET